MIRMHYKLKKTHLHKPPFYTEAKLQDDCYYSNIQSDRLKNKWYLYALPMMCTNMHQPWQKALSLTMGIIWYIYEIVFMFISVNKSCISLNWSHKNIPSPSSTTAWITIGKTPLSSSKFNYGHKNKPHEMIHINLSHFTWSCLDMLNY